VGGGVLLERWFRVAVLLLALSVLLNIWAIYRLRILSEEVIAIRLLPIGTTDIERRIAELEAMLRQIREEQRWITPVQPELGTRVGDTQKVKLTWQIKEYPPGASVTFYYRERGADEFEAMPATSAGLGRFQVELEIERQVAPQWVISRVYKGKTAVRTDQVALPTPFSHLYEYYITVEDGECIRSSEVGTIDLRKVSMMTVPPLQVQLEIDEEKDQVRVTLFERATREPEIKLARAFLEVYAGEVKLAEEELQVAGTDRHGDWDVPIYEVVWWNSRGRFFDRLYLRVEYDNGETVRQDILGQ